MAKAPELQETRIHSSHPDPSDADRRRAILEELERVLNGKHFRNSGRAKQFLQFIVKRTLDGHAEDLKERTIGTELFQRSPDYSTGDDPVVRVQAGLVRRRLEHHYQEPQESSSVRIELPLGSYAPEFQWLTSASSSEAQAPVVESLSAGSGLRKSFLNPKSLAGFILVAAIVLTAGIVQLKLHRTETRKSALERFWAPAVTSQQPVLLCLADAINYRPKPELYDKYEHSHPGTFATQTQRANVPFPLDPSEKIRWGDLALITEWGITRGDLATAVKLAAFFGKIGKPVDLRVESEYSYRDLRDAPAILVGAFNNEWTMNLVSDLRFTFAEDSSGIRISDKNIPGRFWPPLPRTSAQDFAIVSRLKDSRTGQFTVIIAGLTSRGTEAAAEFVANPSDLEAGLKGAPPDWTVRNLELVIETDVIQGVSGPPHVVASYYW